VIATAVRGLEKENTPNIGYTENPHDYETVSNAGSFFLSPNGTSKWISGGDIDVAIGMQPGSLNLPDS
jgi:hypothetical protein